MIKILFLCHGNICRSPMAEFVMNELVRRSGRTDIQVESVALHTDEIGNDIHRGTREKLRQMVIPFEPRTAWLLNAAKAREYDYLVGMDAYNIADLRRLVYPEDIPKIHKLLDFAGKTRDIADPWYTGNFDARSIFDRVSSDSFPCFPANFSRFRKPAEPKQDPPRRFSIAHHQ